MIEKIKVLFLAANSADKNRLRFEQEAREVRQRIRRGRYRDAFDLQTEWAVRPSELQVALLEHQPHVVHFSGRGSEGHGIILEDDGGNPTPVATAALAELFTILNDNVRLVVFNACYSEQQARALTDVIDYSIGMSSAFDDDAAVSFSASFYQALAYARTVEEAFKLARVGLKIEDKPGSEIPVLRARPGVDIAQPFLRTEPEGAAFDLTGVEQWAKRAREGLDPYILPRISRLVVREKYLPKIRQSVAEGRRRVIPIIGPAGCGKSTILGDIYDELTKAGAAWVALVRCTDLLIDAADFSVERLALSLGKTMAGVTQSAAEVARRLTAERGRGVLLVDTLDIVLNERLVPGFRGVLLQLVDSDVTVVFTCRDYEYSAFLEPTGERLAGIVENIDRYQVPQFAPAEIEEATLRFIQNRPGVNPRGASRSFAKSVLELSSDNRSLGEVISNPLLLAMLCDLFGEEGIVPHDLTVSKLYEQYWEAKINRSRKHGQHSPEAMQKSKLSLDIARAVFEMSGERLHEWIYESDLELTASPAVSAAYAELFSEGVLKMRPGIKVHFFHQTFLEYAIALWLATRSGERQREQLLSSLKEPQVARSRLHWWPILRHLLAISEAEEFDRLLGRLDLSNLATFRAAAYAAVSHTDAAKVRKLSPQAFELGDEYQNTLRNAIESAPGHLAEAAWEITAHLVARSSWRTAVKAAQTAGALVARRGKVLGSRLAEMFDAIEQRTYPVDVGEAERDGTATLVGWFLAAILRAAENGVSPEVLRTLRDYYPRFNETHRVTVLRLHLVPGTSADEQQALLEIVATEPAAPRLKEELTTLLERLLPNLVTASGSRFGSSLRDTLRAQLPDGWDKILSRAVGRQLANNQRALDSILEDLFRGDEGDISRNQTAISEALRSGAAQKVLASLLNIPAETIPVRRIELIVTLVRGLAGAIDPLGREKLVEWLRPLLPDHPDKLVPALVFISNDSTSAGQLLLEPMSQLPKSQRAKYSKRILRSASAPTIAILANELEALLVAALPDADSEIALAELYGLRAKDSPEAITRLIKLSSASSTRVALAASRNLVKAAERVEKLEARSLLPLSGSRVDGVRLNWLKALTLAVDKGLPLEGQDIADACAALGKETQELVLQQACHLTAHWVQASKRVPQTVALAFTTFAGRLLGGGVAGDGTVRALIITLKVIAQSEDPTLLPQISAAARSVLRSIDLRRIDDGESEMVDLLSAIARTDQAFLPAVVGDCPGLPWRNARAVASAVKRVEGAASPLLDRILAGDRCLPEVRAFILELRGL